MKAVNLLPSEQRGSAKTQAASTSSKPSGGAFGAYVVLGVLAFAVVALAGYVLTTNSIKDRKAELAKVTREAEATQAKAAALQSFADFKLLADQRLATVKGLADSRFDWERTLSDLSRALPRDVHLKSLSGTTGTQVSGASGGSLRGAIQAPALEMSGCTTSQSGVARLMSRLRNVRGVTRVSLTKSDKDAAGAVTVAAAPTGDQPASLCPKGAPPAFDIVVFFERAAVNANAAPNVGASTTGQPGGTSTSLPQNQTNTTTPNGSAPTQSPSTGSGVQTAPSQAASSAAQTQGVSAK